MKIEDFKILNLNELENIYGGGNVLDCAAGIGASVATLGVAATTPVGWIGLGALALSGGLSGFASGYSCTALYFEGN